MDLSDRGERGDVRRVNVDLRSSDRYDGAETRAAAMAWKRYSFFLFRFLLILSNGETEGTTKKGNRRMKYRSTTHQLTNCSGDQPIFDDIGTFVFIEDLSSFTLSVVSARLPRLQIEN